MSSARSKFAWENGITMAEFLAREEPLGARAELPTESSFWQLADLVMQASTRALGTDGSHERARRKIKRNHLIVSGFRDAPTKSPAPVEVARQHILSGEICWLSGTLAHGSFHYSKLRVTSKAALRRMKDFNELHKRKYKQAIEVEIRSLLSEQDFCEKLRKQQVGVLRAELLLKGIKLNISDKSVERIIFQIKGQNIRSSINTKRP